MNETEHLLSDKTEQFITAQFPDYARKEFYTKWRAFFGIVISFQRSMDAAKNL